MNCSAFIKVSLLCLLSAAVTRAQTTVLVAGWDFNGSIIDVKNVAANYADDYTGANGKTNSASDGTSANARGSLLMNGTFGSELIGPGVNGSAQSANGYTTDKYITTRKLGSVGDSIGFIAGADNAIGIQVKSSTAPQTFAYSLSSLGVADLKLSVDLARNLTSDLSITWGYNIGGVFTSLGVTTTLTNAAGVYSTYDIDFSAVSALDNLAQVSLIGMANSTSASNVQLRMDNVAIYGTLLSGGGTPMAQTFWKGGDGTWTAAATPTEWRDSVGGTTQGFWSPAVATFGGTPGTVTVDNTGGAVSFTGAKFLVSGYTVAGAALTTTTASTPVQVGDGTAAGAAMTATISAPLAGTGGLEKTDTGTLVLSGANTYTGTTTVTAGTLSINGDQSAATGAVSVASGATLGGAGKTGGAVTVQNGGILSGRAGSTFALPSLTLNATSQVNVSLGAPSTTELFKVNGALTLDGVLNVTNAGGFGVGLYRLIDFTGAVTNNGLQIGTIPGISSNFGIQVTSNQVNLVQDTTRINFWRGGAGTWSADATGTAWTNSNASTNGAWQPQAAIFAAAPGTVTVNTTAGAVVFTGAQFAATGYTVAGGTLTTNTASTTLQVGDGTSAGAAMTATISAPIAGTGGVDKTDLGTLVLSGANTYTGTTTVTAGTLAIKGDQSAANGAVTVAAAGQLGGTGTLGGVVTVQNGGTLLGQTGSVLTMPGLILSATSNLNVSLGAPSPSELFKVNGDLTLDGVLNVTGTGAFGAGLYRLIDYTGALTNNGLELGTFPESTTGWAVQTSVAHQVNLFFDSGTTPPPPTNLNLWRGANGVWTADASSVAWTNIEGTGTGAWQPMMAIFQGRPGTVTVNTTAGAVEFTGLQFASSGYTITGGDLTTTTATTALRVGDGSSSGAAYTGKIASAITGTGGIDKTDLGTLILAGTNTFSGGTTITAGTLQLGAGGTSGSLVGDVTNNATLAFNRSDALTFSGVISGTGAVVQRGIGTTTLTGANTYTGGTTVTAGTLLVNGDNSGATGATTVAAGGALGGTGTLGGAVTVQNGGKLIGQAGSTLTSSGLTLDAGSSVAVRVGAPSTTPLFQVNGELSLGGLLTIGNAGGFAAGTYRLIDYTGALSGTMAGFASAPANPGDLSIETSVANQVNVIFNPTVIGYWGGATGTGGSGTWTANAAGAAWTNFAGASPGAWTPQVATFRGTAGTVTVDNTAGAVVFTGAQFTTSGYTVTGATLTTNTAGAVVQVGDGTSGGAGQTATIAAAVAGTGGLNKTDLGTLVLTGANSYAGGTTVTGGTLEVNGNQTGATGAVTVEAGGRLGGTGTLGGVVTVENGGTLFGAAGGVLTMPGLVLNATSNLNVALGAPSTAGLFQVNGALTLDGVLNVTNAGGYGPGLYRLINYTGTLTNNGLALGTLPAGALTPQIQTTVANQVNLFLETAALPVWTGGSGTWSADPAASTWGSVDGTQAGGWKPSVAVFQGAPGTVTVDTTAGAVAVTGVQFASGGYTVNGGALTTTTPATPFRVGDGTGAGAAMTATIGSAIVGSGGLDKTDLGTLVLTGTNTYSGGTTITNGTLQLGAGGASGSLTGNVTNNATLAVNRSDEFNFAGTISGTGAVTQLGTGTTILTAANTYRGGTTITAGTLQLGDGGTSGSLTGNVTNNATLAVDRSNTLTLAGTISGTGEVAQRGTGTTILTGTNTYTGGTTIEAGTLQLGAGGASGSLTGNVTNNATLAVNRSDAVKLTGAISGTGAVVQAGPGTTTLTGANTYTGGTTITAGVLEVADNANLGGASGGVALNGGTLRAGAGFTTARNVTVGSGGGTIDTGANVLVLQGSLAGTGALVKTGAGQLTVAGANTFSGTTTLSEGAIVLNASSLGALNIAAGARLGGVGTIRGNLANAGLLSPGSSPGTIAVAGNFTQNATGTLAMELASATAFDQLQIAGTANLGGALVVTGLGGYVPAPGQTFPILEVTGTVTGQFATLTSPWAQLSPMLRFEALYGSHEVKLSMTQLPFKDLAGTPNQKAVGAGVDGAIALGAIPNLQRALDALPTEAKVSAALTELSPQRYERWFDQAVYVAGATIRAAEGRMEQVRREARGGLWADVVHREADYDATAETPKASSTASGLLVGGDARVTPDLQVGLAFGYTNEALELDEAGSTADVQRISATLYGRLDLTPVFVETVLGATHAALESRRLIAIPGYSREAEVDTSSQERYASVRSGYAFALGSLTRLTPYAGLNYVGWSADAVSETGADEAGLRLHSQSRSSLASRAGLMLEVPFMAENVSFTPRLDVAWRHEFHSDGGQLAAELGGSPFSVHSGSATTGGLAGDLGLNSLPAARKADGVLAGLGFDVTFGARLTAYLRLAGEWSAAADKALEARAGTEIRF